MSIEAMKQVIELYDKHCYNNDYGGIEFNRKHGYKFIEAIEALRTAIQQAEARTDEPVVKNGHMVMVDSGALQMVRNALRRDAGNGMRIRAEMLAALDAATHPAPGVPDDVVRDAERYRWLCEKLGQTQLPTLIERITAGYVADYKPSIDDAIDAAMLTASPAQKGGE